MLMNKIKLMQLIQSELHKKNDGDTFGIVVSSINVFNSTSVMMVIQYLDESGYTYIEDIYTSSTSEDDLMQWLEVLQNERV